MRHTRKVTSSPHSAPEENRMAEFHHAQYTPEMLLWNLLKSGDVLGLHFERTKIIDGVSIDFYCAEKSIAIEIFSDVQINTFHYDERRFDVLQTHGIQVIHLSARSILMDMNECYTALVTLIGVVQPPHSR